VHLARGVHHRECAQHVFGKRAQRPLVGRGLHVAPQVQQALAAIERHDAICRAIGFAQLQHADERGMLETDQHARFVDEGAEAARERVFLPCVDCVHRLVGLTAHEARRKVFLDGHRHRERMVDRLIDDRARAARKHDLEFERAEVRTGGQRRIDQAGWMR